MFCKRCHKRSAQCICRGGPQVGRRLRTPYTCDAVVIGAGASGLKAANDLLAAGKSVVIVEAKARLGGRAFTDESAAMPMPFDAGCQWLHARQWWDEAKALDVVTEAQDEIGFAQDQASEWTRKECGELFMHAYWPLEETFQGAGDVTAATAVARLRRQRRDDAAFGRRYPLAAGLLGALEESIELDEFSVVDLDEEEDGEGEDGEGEDGEGEDGEGEDGEGKDGEGKDGEGKDEDHKGGNYVAQKGFGALIHGYGDELRKKMAVAKNGSQIMLSTPVTHVDYQGERIDVKILSQTSHYSSISCRAVVVTASVGVINDEVIKFSPPMDADVRKAFGLLAMGHYKKIALQFNPPNIFLGVVTKPPLDLAAAYNVDQVLYHFDATTETAWKLLVRFPSNRAGGTVVVIAMVGGSVAEELDEAGPRVARETALRIVREVTGEVDRTTVKSAVSSWSTDPWTRGAYSYTLPGGKGARQTIVDGSLDDRVFFAGEAISCDGYGSAHVAYLSGARAAGRVLAVL